MQAHRAGLGSGDDDGGLVSTVSAVLVQTSVRESMYESAWRGGSDRRKKKL